MECPRHVGGEEEVDFQTQFSALLCPMKDLNKNWTVDLASYLQQYMEGFIQHAQSTTGLSKLNFAQAAMLIQSSAHIYGKKVQFLYNLTFQLYEQVINKKKSKQNDVSEQGEDTAVESASVVEQFLSLDDIPVNNNTNRGNSGKGCSTSCLRTPVPHMLTMLDDMEKQSHMLVNMKGVQLGKRKDSSLNRFLVGPSGSLLSYGSEEDLPLTRSSSGLPQFPPQNLLNDADNSIGGDPDMNSDLDASVFHAEPASPLPSGPPELPQSTEKRTRQSIAPRPLISPERTPPIVDLFRNCLDPHEVMKVPEKSLKEMKVHRSPQKSKKLKRGRNNEEIKENVDTSSLNMNIMALDINVLHDIMYSNVRKFPKNPLKVPNNEALYHQYYQQHKTDLKTFKETLRKRKRFIGNDISDVDSEDHDNFGSEAPNIDDDVHSDDEEPIQQLDLEDLPINQHNAEAPAHIGDIIGSQDVPVCSSYEELARKQIEEFHQQSAKFHCGTDIGKKVAEWEETIQPYLDLEEQRRTYDIHEYGSDILNCFEDNNRKQTISFAVVVKGKELFEIPRYFLSSLMLANCYNVELTSKGELEEGMDTLELTLLSRKRHHEALGDFKTS